jgi:hypothetical protein
MLNLLKRIYFFLFFLGFDARKFASFKNLPRFNKDRKTFLSKGGKIKRIYPELSDYYDSAGEAKGHYFHQDLLVASFIKERSPKRHIDIGSRIDGFVAHVASFREIEVLDIRDLDKSIHKNLIFLKRDLMKDVDDLKDSSDSISCLHAIEHFGLGRYGDTIDPKGHISGFKNIVEMLAVGGILYISFPISDNPGVHFNSQRVLDPIEILSWSDRVKLERFDLVDDQGSLHLNADIKSILNQKYALGIYTLRKE